MFVILFKFWQQGILILVKRMKSSSVISGGSRIIIEKEPTNSRIPIIWVGRRNEKEVKLF